MKLKFTELLKKSVRNYELLEKRDGVKMHSDPEKYIIRLEPEIITRLALAVFVADDYAPNKPPLGSIKVLIKNRNLEAIKNPSGYYLFLNLPDSNYSVQTKSDYYFDQEVDITIPREFGGNYILDKKVDVGAKEAILTDVTDLKNGDVLEFDNGNDHIERRWITLHQDPNIPKIYWDEDIRGGLEYVYDAGTVLKIPDGQIRQQERLIRIDLKPNSSYPFPSVATLIRGVIQDNDGNAVSDATIKVEKITLGNEQPETPLERIGEDIKTISSDNGDFALYFMMFKFERNKENNNNNNNILVDLKVTHKDFQDYEIKDLNILKEQANVIDIINLQERP